jgi:glucan 1,3-beta-glucosidase
MLFALALSGGAFDKPAVAGFVKAGHAPAPIRGVNLGGWFVLEPWITPTIFEVANRSLLARGAVVKDQWTLCQVLGAQHSLIVLEAHWASWVSPDELYRLSRAGINTVRIPVGYWMFDIEPGEPWVGAERSWHYLVQGLRWAKEFNLEVVLDLHGAPGSQNGYDNSGKRGSIDWQTGGDDSAPHYSSHVNRTVKVLGLMAQKVSLLPAALQNAVRWIELLNEPNGRMPKRIRMDVVTQFYKSAYAAVKRWLPHQHIILHDAFKSFDQMWPRLAKSFRGDILIDTHQYQAFGQAQLELARSEHIDAACKLKTRVREFNQQVPLVVGEWSLATSDCAPWLHGFGNGHIWDGSMRESPQGVPIRNTSKQMHRRCSSWQEGQLDVGKFDPEYRAFLRKFAEVQMDAFEQGRGWFFWNFKTEGHGAPQWDFLLGLQEGLIPPHVAQRTHSCRYYY